MKSQPEGRLRRTDVSVWVHPRDNYQRQMNVPMPGWSRYGILVQEVVIQIQYPRNQCQMFWPLCISHHYWCTKQVWTFSPFWEVSLLIKTVQAVVHPMGKVMVTTIPQHTLKTIKLCFEGRPCDWSMQDNNNFHGKIDAAEHTVSIAKNYDGPLKRIWELAGNFAETWHLKRVEQKLRRVAMISCTSKDVFQNKMKRISITYW